MVKRLWDNALINSKLQAPQKKNQVQFPHPESNSPLPETVHGQFPVGGEGGGGGVWMLKVRIDQRISHRKLSFSSCANVRLTKHLCDRCDVWQHEQLSVIKIMRLS